jgi:hypothetical protein
LYSASLLENATVGTFILAVKALDKDATVNGLVVYSLVSMNDGEDVSGIISFNQSTGSFFVAQTLNYDNMTRKVGPAKAQQFTRLYVSPGVSHIGSAPTVDNSPVADKVDLLGALDAWVDKGAAPGTLTATSYTTGTNPQVVATRPMCPYPTYPHFTGTGDWKKAENFTCRSLK